MLTSPDWQKKTWWRSPLWKHCSFRFFKPPARFIKHTFHVMEGISIWLLITAAARLCSNWINSNRFRVDDALMPYMAVRRAEIKEGERAPKRACARFNLILFICITRTKCPVVYWKPKYSAVAEDDASMPYMTVCRAEIKEGEGPEASMRPF